jgi:hypothetical protein
VFKKPGEHKYCLYFNDDDKWTLGEKYTRGDQYTDRLSMKQANLDLPTTSVWKSVVGSAKVGVDAATYRPEYPDYYQVQSTKSSYLDGFYKKLPKYQNYNNFPVFKKNTENNYVLSLHSDGDWKFSLGTSAAGGLARSSEKGLPSPGLSKGWEIWMNKDWRKGGNLKMLALNPVYPASEIRNGKSKSNRNNKHWHGCGYHYWSDSIGSLLDSYCCCIQKGVVKSKQGRTQD